MGAHLFHRAAAIYMKQLHPDFTIRVRRPDKAFRQAYIHPRVMRYIQIAGFYGVCRLYKSRNVDNHLITALIERWRQETHTFHLPVGEATITLQDVEVLLGIPIDGEPVIGYDFGVHRDWTGKWQDLLGFAPERNDIRGLRMKLAAFQRCLAVLAPVDDNTPDLEVQHRARMYLLLLIGGMLLPDTSGALMPMYFLDLVANFRRCGRYSWGSAVLAYLYRYLCKATLAGTKDIGGCTLLVQLWAWERITVVRPLPLEHEMSMEELGGRPVGARWRVLLDTTMTSQHAVSIYRDQLSGLKFDQFIWQPYSDELLSCIPPYCTAGRHLWKVVVPLIAWEIVEWHLPHRVLRQFGIIQPIPRVIDTFEQLHRVTRCNNFDQDWRISHSDYIEQWRNRTQLVETGEPCDPAVPSHEYLQWFRRVTVLHISNPYEREGQTGYAGANAPYEYTIDAMSCIANTCINYEETRDDRHLSTMLESVRGESVGSMLYLRESQRLELEANQRQDDDHPRPNLPPPVRQLGRTVGRQRRIQQAHNRAQSPVVGPRRSHEQNPEFGAGSSSFTSHEQNPEFGAGSSSFTAQQGPLFGEGSSAFAAYSDLGFGTGSSSFAAQQGPGFGAGTSAFMSYQTPLFGAGTSFFMSEQNPVFGSQTLDPSRPSFDLGFSWSERNMGSSFVWHPRNQNIDDEEEEDNGQNDSEDDHQNEGENEAQGNVRARRSSERIQAQQRCPRNIRLRHACGLDCSITPAEKKKTRGKKNNFVS